MNDRKRKNWGVAAGILVLFALWTVAVCLVDVQKIGPQESAVGFATMNGFFHRLTGVHMRLYMITDWLGLIPVVCGLGFALLGLVQWISRKSIRKVDRSILMLGGFYIAVIAAYVFFEALPVNYRPVLIAGALEASYPSSTTLLVLCVMPTTAMQLQSRIKSVWPRRCVLWAICAFIAFMVLGRLFSGVHWLSDIVGGVLLSGGLVLLYHLAAGSE